MGDIYKFLLEVLCKVLHITRTARLVRRRADEKDRGSQILDLTGVDIVAVVALVGVFGGVVVAGFAVGPGDVFPHESTDVLAGSPAIQAEAGEPTVRVNGDDQGRVAEQVLIAGFVNLNMGLGIRHTGEFLDFHFVFPFRFFLIRLYHTFGSLSRVFLKKGYFLITLFQLDFEVMVAGDFGKPDIVAAKGVVIFVAGDAGLGFTVDSNRIVKFIHFLFSPFVSFCLYYNTLLVGCQEFFEIFLWRGMLELNQPIVEARTSKPHRIYPPCRGEMELL